MIGRDISEKDVAALVKRGKSAGRIAVELGISVSAVNGFKKSAMRAGLIDRMEYAYGKKKLENYLIKGVTKRGTITQILSALDDDETEFLLSKLGKRTSLHYAILEIIRNAARGNS